MTSNEEQRQFWNEIILNDDGSVDLDAVYKELRDYHFVMRQAARVYYDITCGQLSKPTYYAQDVVEVANACSDRAFREEILGVLTDIQDGAITLEEALEEYSETLDPDVQTTVDGI